MRHSGPIKTHFSTVSLYICGRNVVFNLRTGAGQLSPPLQHACPVFSPALWSFGAPALPPSTTEITGKANLCCCMSLKVCRASRGGGPFVTEEEEQEGGADTQRSVMSCLTARGEPTEQCGWTAVSEKQPQ